MIFQAVKSIEAPLPSASDFRQNKAGGWRSQASVDFFLSDFSP
jgi:hypothetical protein